jgi:hypothetical protein
MRARPIIHRFFDEPTTTVTYIVADPTTGATFTLRMSLKYSVF